MAQERSLHMIIRGSARAVFCSLVTTVPCRAESPAAARSSTCFLLALFFKNRPCASRGRARATLADWLWAPNCIDRFVCVLHEQVSALVWPRCLARPGGLSFVATAMPGNLYAARFLSCCKALGAVIVFSDPSTPALPSCGGRDYSRQ